MTAENKSILSVSLDPGIVLKTGLRKRISLSNLLDLYIKSIFSERLRAVLFSSRQCKSIQQGAALLVYACFSPDVVVSTHCVDSNMNAVLKTILHPMASNADLGKR